ncbi:hypothetical protein HELRODRAFT_178190 [Helobdella robusta]|uniref:PUM-HD domain-containing protein n=1 Tax=Helobdella robusta TaxID=6412 RepID=T1FCW9_HELRO|nr:hypothetical protein HELRODRAFT_178190 [Helobdella robusta]ESN97399.1 hypothetical protein HELRODRAFT_178190 [Helobdella robusta]
MERSWHSPLNKSVRPLRIDHVCNTLSNPVLQSMVLSLKSLPVNVSSELLSNFIENSELFTEHVDKKLLVVSEKEIGSYLLEQVLITLSDDRFEEIFSLHFKGKLLHMATSPIGNFVLQRLIKSSRNKKQVAI